MTIASFFRSAPRAVAITLAGTLVLHHGAARAADAAGAAPASAKTERCLLLNRIQHTKVVDEKTVLFYMSGNEIYKNVLPYKCGGLRTDETFGYKSSINQICSVDTITPLVSTGGSYMKTASCGLGTFELIDKTTADKLLGDAKAAR